MDRFACYHQGMLLGEQEDLQGDGSDAFEVTTGVHHNDRWWMFVSVSESLQSFLLLHQRLL